MKAYLLPTIMFFVLLSTVALADSSSFLLTWGNDQIGRTQAIAVDKYENIFVLGSFHNEVDFDPGLEENVLSSGDYYDTYISKFNSDGEYQWTLNCLPGCHAIPRDLVTDAAGNVYLAWTVNNILDVIPGPDTRDWDFPLNSGGTFIVKLSNDGDYIWSSLINASISAMTVDRNGDLYLAGVCSWPYFFQYNGEANGVNERVSAVNAILFKINSEGNRQWVRVLQGPGKSEATCVGVDSESNIYMGGLYADSVDFDPGDGQEIHTANEDFDNGFLCKFDVAGEFKWVKPSEGGYIDGLEGIYINPENEIIIVGNYIYHPPTFGSHDANEGPNNETIGTFYAKFDNSGSLAWLNTIVCSDEINHIGSYSVSGNLHGIHIAGLYEGKFTLDDVQNNIELVSEDHGSPIILTLNDNGEIIDAKSFYTSGWAWPTDIAANGNGIVMSGTSYYFIQLTAEEDGEQGISMGDTGSFIVKFYNETGTVTY